MTNNSPLLTNKTRFLLPEGAYSVLNKATQLEQQGKKIIHLEIGQPDFSTPKNISQADVHAINAGFTKYTPPLGILSLRQEIAKYLNRSRNVEINPEQIAVTPSAKNAIFTAMSLVINHGDEVIYPDPGFPTYSSLINFLGGSGIPIPLLEENNFSFDMKLFRKKLSSKTKLIILNSPSNPTGGIIPVEILSEIADLIKNIGCWILTDEIYSRFLYGLEKYHSFYSNKDVQNRTFLIDGFSKTYSMTGWRIGYLAVPVANIDKVDSFLTHSIGCTASFTQQAALTALTGTDTEFKAMLKEFTVRRELIVNLLNSIPGISCSMPQGAFYVFPNIKKLGKSSKWWANYILKEAGVALLDGTSFGEYGEGYLRISYATSKDNLIEGIRRIKEVIH